MIIHSVLATNVLKYAQLELTDLPEQALIAISGSNESGKTTVVETICFALFGRTFSLPSDEITKIIHWGETACQVELEFSVADGTRYQVSRTLAADGIQGATLKKAGEMDVIASGEREVAAAIEELSGFTFHQYLDSLYLAQREISAPSSQSETIKAVAGGMELEQVANSLQRDIKVEQDDVVKIEQEINSIEEKIDDLELDDDAVNQLNRQNDDLDKEIIENETQINLFRQVSDDLTLSGQRFEDVGAELLSASTSMSYAHWRDYGNRLSNSLQGIEQACIELDTDNHLCEGDELKNFVWEYEGRLSAFDTVKEKAGELRADLAIQLGELDLEGADEQSTSELSLPWQQSQVQKKLATARRWQILARFNLLLMVLITLSSWVAWAAVIRFPSHEISLSLAEMVKPYISSWPLDIQQWLFPVAGAVSALTLFVLIRLFNHGSRVKKATAEHALLGRRIEEARHKADLIDHMDSMAFPHAIESLDELGDSELTDAAIEFAEGAGNSLLDESKLSEMQERVHQLMQNADLHIREVREDIAAAIGALDNENDRCRREIAVVKQEIELEQEKQRMAEAHEAEIAALHDAIPPHLERIKLLELARELVKQTCQDLYSRFNKVLREYTGAVMPLFTDGRYQHLQIDDNLKVRVFSSDKNDFADLGEVSSGTQRQIMLAVRLAMAKSMTQAAVKGSQFVILDEPFAFFDGQRTRSTMEALPQVDSLMSQIWIIAQEFEEAGPYTIRLDCSREYKQLRYQYKPVISAAPNLA